jgi:SMI1 / KNR4 family (SUKH-1)
MFVEQIAQWGEAEFNLPATEQELHDCQLALGHVVPDELRALLLETNGIEGEDGTGLLWTAERIGIDNAEFRDNLDMAELYMPFDALVFFADSGDGNQFGVSRRGNLEVYEWDHENDSRTWVASSVLRFIEDFMTGKLDAEDEDDKEDADAEDEGD